MWVNLRVYTPGSSTSPRLGPKRRSTNDNPVYFATGAIAARWAPLNRAPALRAASVMPR
jgi:hypothetical protein